jgi:hypothetical protein
VPCEQPTAPPRDPALSARRMRAAVLALGVALSALPGAAADGDGGVADRPTCYRIDAASASCYERPRPFAFVLNAPRDIGGWVRSGFRRENALTVMGIAVATAGLIAVDQDLWHGAHRLGSTLHVSEGRTATAPGVPVPYPTDMGSALYYIGDGMVPITITAGLLTYGLVASDRRALQTTSHLAEGLLSVALVAQTLKHITGRQSPSRATEPGGRWRPLSDPTVYHKDVPAFDAFPSGHMATAMVTVTVLAEDYPEYRLIRPVGYGLMTLLGIQMLNNDVHWASDYPLALAIGYGLGKRAASDGRRIVSTTESPDAAGARRGSELAFVPLPVRDGGGLAAIGRF